MLYTNTSSNLSQTNLQREYNLDNQISEQTRRIHSVLYRLNYSSSPRAKRVLKIIEEVISYWLNGKTLYKSEFTLAKEFGVSNITISRDMEELKRTCIVEVRHRFNNSNVYLLSHYCFMQDFLDEFIRWFPVLHRLNYNNDKLPKDSYCSINKKEEDCVFSRLRNESILWLRNWKPLKEQISEAWEYICSGKVYIPPEDSES